MNKVCRVKRADYITPTCTSVLCSEHFQPEDYESVVMQAFGFKGKYGTRVRKDAEPTIQSVPPCTRRGTLEGSQS